MLWILHLGPRCHQASSEKPTLCKRNLIAWSLYANPERLRNHIRSVANGAFYRLQPEARDRQSILPLDASAFESVSPEDAKWLAEQEARFASDSEGLATKPNFALISFEAVNFMDGHRSTAEIADLLSAEYLLDIDQAWVDRLVSILEKQKLVSR